MALQSINFIIQELLVAQSRSGRPLTAGILELSWFPWGLYRYWQLLFSIKRMLRNWNYNLKQCSIPYHCVSLISSSSSLYSCCWWWSSKDEFFFINYRIGFSLNGPLFYLLIDLLFNRSGNIFLIRELKHTMNLNRTLAIPST